MIHELEHAAHDKAVANRDVATEEVGAYTAQMKYALEQIAAGDTKGIAQIAAEWGMGLLCGAVLASDGNAAFKDLVRKINKASTGGRQAQRRHARERCSATRRSLPTRSTSWPRTKASTGATRRRSRASRERACSRPARPRRRALTARGASAGAASLVTMEAESEPGLGGASRMRLGFAIAGAVIVLSMAGATVGIGMVQVHHIATVVRHYGHVEPFRRGTITPPPSGKPQTLLLVGSDRRYGDARGDAHSDTLMLVRLDPKQNATTVLSIPRDLRVTIPGHGIDKINAAYGEGGLDLTTRTVKQLLSTPGRRFRVNHAIAINFKGFRDAVDIVHCVYIDVDRRYYHSNLGVPIGQRYAEIDVQPGYQRLCGQQALDYVRFRHLDNDIVRAARQQDFLRQASAQLSTSSLLRNLNPLVKAFAKATSSDSNLQTSRGILRLLRLAASSTGRPVRQVRFPHTFVQSAPRRHGADDADARSRRRRPRSDWATT